MKIFNILEEAPTLIRMFAVPSDRRRKNENYSSKLLGHKHTWTVFQDLGRILATHSSNSWTTEAEATGFTGGETGLHNKTLFQKYSVTLQSTPYA